MSIVVTVQGQEFRTEDLTIDEAIEVEELTGESWASLNPYRSAKQYKAIAAVFLKRTMSEDDALKIVGSITCDDALDGVRMDADDDLPTLYEDGVPLGEGAPSTP